MNFARTLSLAFSLIAAAAGARAQSWVIDPALGVDAPGRGSSAAPLRTMSYAARLAAVLGVGDFVLRPGRYDNASGEVFPIVLPPLCVVRRDPGSDLDPRPVEIATPLALTTAFLLQSALPIDARFERLEIRGGTYRAIQILPGAAKLMSRVLVQRCELGCSRGVATQVLQGAQLELVIEECAIASPEVGVLANVADPGSSLDLRIDRTRVEGAIRGLQLDASNNGAIDAAVRAAILRRCSTEAVRCSSATSGAISSRFEHVLFAEVGVRVIGGNLAAFQDAVGNLGIPGRHTLVNCLFVGNRGDVQATRGFGSFIFGANLVEQANLVGLGGNVLGTARFASDASGRLAEGSPGLDLGRAADVTLARDLDDLPRLDLSSGAPDVGPFERHFGAVPPRTRDAAIAGRIARIDFVVQGPAQTPCALLFGLPIPTGFGPGLLHLSPPFVELGVAGVLDASGTQSLTLSFPDPGGLAGFVFGAQAIVLAPPYLGAHAANVRLLR
ncbi:MAG: DUF1565 domain-containing protein [Planctomycetes bacterium]|nr:DUF1565 domain-containing protein [Planctomycetota bacterium]